MTPVPDYTPAPASSAGRLRRAAAPALAVLGILLLGARGVSEVAHHSPRTGMWTAIAAATTFLLATLLRRGTQRHMPLWRAGLLSGAVLSGLLAAWAAWQATERSGLRVLLVLIPVSLLITTSLLSIREADMQRRQSRIRALRSRLDGEEGERRRWARELHDDTLQELAVVHVLLATAAATRDPDARSGAIAEAGELVGRQIQALRRLIANMRPVAIESLGLDAALEALAAHTAEVSGTAIEVTLDPLPRLTTETELCVYRIVQEGLNNAVRHSGGGRITITARTRERWLEVCVYDDGRQHSPRKFVAGHGLLGMMERAESLGAQLRVLPGDPTGTAVRLKVPI